MDRREVIATLVAWALSSPASGAEPALPVRRVGVLAQDLQPGLLETFRDRLRQLGFSEGSNLVIETRNAAGHNDRLAALADELLRRKVEVIVAVNTPAAQAAKRATRAIPVVMMRVADPVKSGIVESLARPGGNVTGISFMPDVLGPKGVELLTEMIPGIQRMAALYQGNNAGAILIVDEVVRKGAQLGLEFVRLPVLGAADYATAFEKASRADAQALFVMDDGAITQQRRPILDLAARYRLPVVSIYKDFAEAGGLVAYGPNLDLVYRRAADYVVKLLQGEQARDLPVEQPIDFDLVVNARTAKALGVTIPPPVLILANEVIR